METAIRIILWAIVWFIGQSVITFILMGLAMDFKNPRDENGVLNFKRRGIINWIYGTNCERSMSGKKIPKNICQLFWGVFGGILFGVFMLTVAIPLSLIGDVFVLFFGVVPRGWLLGGACHPYKRFGKNNEKRLWIAPWEIAVVLFLLFNIDRVTLSARDAANIAISAVSSAVLWIAIVASSAVLVVVFIAGIFTCVFEPAKEFYKERKDKVCWKINVT